MGAFSQRWNKQPHVAALNHNNSIAFGLIGGFNAAAASASSRRMGALSNPLTYGLVRGEIAISDTGVTANQAIWTGNASPESSALTVLVRAMRFGAQPDSGFGGAFLLPKVAGTQDPFHLFIKTSGERFRINTTTIDNNESAETTTDWVVGQWMVGVYRWRSGEAPTAWRDGVLQSLSTTPATTRSGVLKPAASMAINVATLRLNGAVSLALVWNRALTDQEIVSISRNPWQVFVPQPRRFFLPEQASTGNTTISLARTSLGFTRYSAQLALATSLSAQQLQYTENAVQPKVAVGLSAPTLNQDGTTHNTSVSTATTSAQLSWSAQALSFFQATLVQLSAATLRFTSYAIEATGAVAAAATSRYYTLRRFLGRR